MNIDCLNNKYLFIVVVVSIAFGSVGIVRAATPDADNKAAAHARRSSSFLARDAIGSKSWGFLVGVAMVTTGTITTTLILAESVFSDRPVTVSGFKTGMFSLATAAVGVAVCIRTCGESYATLEPLAQQYTDLLRNYNTLEGKYNQLQQTLQQQLDNNE